MVSPDSNAPDNIQTEINKLETRTDINNAKSTVKKDSNIVYSMVLVILLFGASILFLIFNQVHLSNKNSTLNRVAAVSQTQVSTLSAANQTQAQVITLLGKDILALEAQLGALGVIPATVPGVVTMTNGMPSLKVTIPRVVPRGSNKVGTSIPAYSSPPSNGNQAPQTKNPPASAPMVPSAPSASPPVNTVPQPTPVTRPTPVPQPTPTPTTVGTSVPTTVVHIPLPVVRVPITVPKIICVNGVCL